MFDVQEILFSHVAVTQKGPEFDVIKTKACEQQKLRHKLSDGHNELYTLVDQEMTADVEVKERFVRLLTDAHEHQAKMVANTTDLETALEIVHAPSTLWQRSFRLPAEKANRTFITKL